MVANRILKCYASGPANQFECFGITDPKPPRSHSPFTKYGFWPICVGWDQALVLEILNNFFQQNARIGSWADVGRVPCGGWSDTNDVHHDERQDGSQHEKGR